MNVMGYETKTTFWEDFTVADRFGEEAVRDTYRRAFGEWKHNTEYVTELVLVLNWKCWQHHELGNGNLRNLYGMLYESANRWCLDNLKGKDFEYYYKTTD